MFAEKFAYGCRGGAGIGELDQLLYGGRAVLDRGEGSGWGTESGRNASRAGEGRCVAPPEKQAKAEPCSHQARQEQPDASHSVVLKAHLKTVLLLLPTR